MQIAPNTFKDGYTVISKQVKCHQLHLGSQHSIYIMSFQLFSSCNDSLICQTIEGRDSSRSRIEGFEASALYRATLYFCPPDNLIRISLFEIG